MDKYKTFISTAKHLTPYLSKELQCLGFSIQSLSETGVSIDATFNDIMHLNLRLRVGHHIFILLKEFECNSPEQLYKEVNDVEWERFIFEDGYISVFSSVSNPTIRDSRFANLKCKDAIVDRLFKLKGKRPNSGPLRDKTVVYLYWNNDKCLLYLDTSGESLSRRGYRKIPLTAPLQETLAAGIIYATGWDKKSNFINPMCGSGTLAIEAALMALNRAPNLFRENFSFMHTKLFDHSLWEKLKKAEEEKEIKNVDLKIISTDIEKKAIDASRKNAVLAGVEKYIEFKVSDYAKTTIPKEKGIIILNPEYGIRMGEISQLKTVYSGIGDFFKQKCSGYTGYIFSANIELLKNVGLKPKRKIIFYNAGIECRLYEYLLYEGSKRAEKITKEQNPE